MNEYMYEWMNELTKQQTNEQLKNILLWMNSMIDFNSIGFAKLWGIGSKRKIQNENILVCIHRESNQRPFVSKLAP